LDDLLALAIDAHGGMKRWDGITRFRAAASITGAIWDLKTKPGLLTDVTFEGDTRDQRVRISPFPAPGCYTTWEPHQETIETPQGVLLEERRNPALSFLGPDRDSPWDELQVAYFAAEACWNYFTTPFLFARPDFVVQELDPWSEDGQMWRRLFVTYPDDVIAHCRQQTYYFDEEGCLRRVDYVVDVLGGWAAVQYPSDYREFNGIMVPTRRRDYVRNQDGSPVLQPVSVAMDVRRVTFN
jgi:hypothetical protein